MADEPKQKVMLKCEGGFIVTKREMKTADDKIWWQLAKSPGAESALLATAEIFEDHGYKVIPWDDEQEALEGKIVFANK